MAEQSLNPELEKWVKERMARYPTKRSLLVPTLLEAQKYHGHISPALAEAIGALLETTPRDVLSVASFYTLVHKHPVGKHVIQLCHNVSCFLNGCDDIAAYIEEKLGIKAGETTEDGKFTFITVECLAACGGGPVMLVDEKLYESVTPQTVDRALAEAN